MFRRKPGKTLSSRAAKPDSRKRTTPAPNHPYSPARVALPRWYLDRIDAEAKLCGFTRRSDFLNALLRRKAGTLALERHPSAPKVKYPKRSELGDVEAYIWNVPIELKRILDILVDQLGGMPVKGWVVLCLHEWLGLPLNPPLLEK